MKKTSAPTIDPAKSFDFLTVYIEGVLAKNGLDRLSEDTKAEFVPRFVAEAEHRLGLALLPKLNAAAANAFADLLENPAATPEDLQAFWQQHVPAYQQIVADTLKAYGAEVGKALAKSA